MSAKTTKPKRVRHRDWYAYDIDVGLNGHPPKPAYVAATKRDALATAVHEGQRMWNKGLGVFKDVRTVVYRHGERIAVFEWHRAHPSTNAPALKREGR